MVISTQLYPFFLMVISVNEFVACVRPGLPVMSNGCQLRPLGSQFSKIVPLNRESFTTFSFQYICLCRYRHTSISPSLMRLDVPQSGMASKPCCCTLLYSAALALNATRRIIRAAFQQRRSFGPGTSLTPPPPSVSYACRRIAPGFQVCAHSRACSPFPR